MRSLLKLLLPGVLLFLTYGDMQSQTDVDSIDLSETVLEERHLRYMYNFALNNSFFQYKSNEHAFQDPFIINRSKRGNVVLVVKQKRPLTVENLEYFIEPDSLKKLNIRHISNLSLFETDLISQFDFEFISLEFADREERSSQINQWVFDPQYSGFVVQLTDKIIINNKIYLSISISYPGNYDPNIHSSGTQMYEFEWCESVGWVYPRRVTDSLFRSYHFTKGRLGGTINIPSLKCYPMED